MIKQLISSLTLIALDSNMVFGVVHPVRSVSVEVLPAAQSEPVHHHATLFIMPYFLGPRVYTTETYICRVHSIKHLANSLFAECRQKTLGKITALDN